jgi:DNA-binding XRE family transcriptional regulator
VDSDEGHQGWQEIGYRDAEFSAGELYDQPGEPITPPQPRAPSRPVPSAEQAMAAMGIMIRQMRHTTKLTQAEVAQRVGLAASDISALERGKAVPSPDTVALTALATGHRLRLSPEPVVEPETAT